MPKAPLLDLAQFLPYRLSVLSNTISQSIAADYEKRFDLSVTQWRVMAVLGQEGDISAREVAARTAMDKVAVSRAVSSLLERKLLLRKIAPTDKRESRLHLSAAGRRIHDQIIPLAMEHERRLLAQLTPEEQQSLSRILDTLQAWQAAGQVVT